MMRDDYSKITCGKKIRIHLRRKKQSERRESKKASRDERVSPDGNEQSTQLDSQPHTSPKTHWSHVPFVSVDKISIDKPTDWKGRPIGCLFSSYRAPSGGGGDSELNTNDISVANSSTAEQSGDDLTEKESYSQLDCPLLINGKSPTIPLERLSLSSNYDHSSNFQGRKLTFDDQALVDKEKLVPTESLLKKYSPTVSLKRLSLPEKPCGNEKAKNDDDDDVVNSGKEDGESIAMHYSRHKKKLEKKWPHSKLTLKKSPRRSLPGVGKSWKEMNTLLKGQKVERANLRRKSTERPVSPVICDADEVSREELTGHDPERLQTKRKRSVTPAKKRKSDVLAKSASLQELVKRQKLKLADVNGNGDGEKRFSFSQEDRVSATQESNQKEKTVQCSPEMNISGEEKSSQEFEKPHDERKVGMSDKKMRNVLGKHGKWKELVKRQKLERRGLKENGDGQHAALFSTECGGNLSGRNHNERENGLSTSVMNLSSGEMSSPQNRNGRIFHELSDWKVVIRPIPKTSHRQILQSHVAALLMNPQKSRKRVQKDPSEAVDQNGFETKMYEELSGSDENEVVEKFGGEEKKLKEMSTGNSTENVNFSTEKMYVGRKTVERVERRLQGEKEWMDGKLNEGVLWKKVDLIGSDNKINEFQSVKKGEKKSSSDGKKPSLEINEKCDVKGASEDFKRKDAVKIEGSVQLVRKMETKSNSPRSKCTSNVSEKCESEGVSSTLNRKDVKEDDYLSSLGLLNGNVDKEKENNPWRIVGSDDGKLVSHAGKDRVRSSKSEKSNSLASISKEVRDKEYTEKLKAKLEEIIKRSRSGKEIGQEEKNSQVFQVSSGSHPSNEKKEVEFEDVGNELQSKKETKFESESALLHGEEKSERGMPANELSIVQSYSPGEDFPDSAKTDSSRQRKDESVSSSNIPLTNKEDQSDDDDVVLEFITPPKSLSSQQIKIFMNGLFQTQDAAKVPSLEETLEKLSKTFRQDMSRWETFVRNHWELMVASRVGTISSMRQEKPLATIGKYSLTTIDMASLENASWLNDNIINSYLLLLSKEAPLKTASFSSFFFQVYRKNGFEHVQRWHRKIDIFACRLILIPIHSRHHWCLVVVDNKERTIIFFDSMKSGGMRYLIKIKAYMNEEAVARQKAPIEWVLQSKEGIPKQRNTSDCGVFVCQYAKRLCYGKQVTFSHAEATHFRQLMKQELLTKRLEPPQINMQS